MPHYRDTESGRFVSAATAERLASEGRDEHIQVLFSAKELAKLAEAEPLPEGEEIDYGEEIDQDFDSDLEDEY
jgi:hypothetical protein